MAKKVVDDSNDNICVELHQILQSGGTRFSFQPGFTEMHKGVKCIQLDEEAWQGTKKQYMAEAQRKSIPNNGIYIMFQKDEFGHGGDRIVRIGTHNGQDQLPSRIKQHFIDRNKDRSIFRKIVGRCFLNQVSSPFLSIWDIDLTQKINSKKYGDTANRVLKTATEIRVSEYLLNNFYFCILNVPNKEDRLYYEERLIGTVSNCRACGPSKNWLGLSSPTTNPRQGGRKIKNTGLWLSKGVYSAPLTTQELVFVRRNLV